MIASHLIQVDRHADADADTGEGFHAYMSLMHALLTLALEHPLQKHAHAKYMQLVHR
jgi:hypothetical protein